MQVNLANEDDVSVRAAKLAEAFKRKERTILILDDLWNNFSLDSAGIVRGGGCKLIFTTRSLKVCHMIGISYADQSGNSF